MESAGGLKVTSSTSDHRLSTFRLEARFDFFGSGTATTWPVSRGSVSVVVSTLAFMVIEVSSCDIVEIASLVFRLVVCRSFVRRFSVWTYCK